MALSDFQVARKPVLFRGEPLIEVRGLALNDISFLIRDHLDQLNALFDMYDKPETRESALVESAQFAITLIKQAPDLVAQMIVLAADEQQSMLDVARKLPLPTQVEAVRAIIELTFEEAGGAKKFIDSLMSLVSGVMPMGSTA
jgi:hypothetical protein